MKLYYSKSSPFARKVIISAEVLKLSSELELVTVDVYQPPSNYKELNPLIKVPSLELPNGEMLTNSPFICQYLNSISSSKNKIFPTDQSLWSALNFQSIADGATDAAVSRRWESHLRSSEKFDPKIDQRHKDKIENSLVFFEKKLTQFSDEKLTISEISLICFVDYLQFRFAHEQWENKFPIAFNWVKNWYTKNPILNQTKPL